MMMIDVKINPEHQQEFVISCIDGRKLFFAQKASREEIIFKVVKSKSRERVSFRSVSDILIGACPHKLTCIFIMAHFAVLNRQQR